MTQIRILVAEDDANLKIIVRKFLLYLDIQQLYNIYICIQESFLKNTEN